MCMGVQASGRGREEEATRWLVEGKHHTMLPG
jgi:hypothetical protein